MKKRLLFILVYALMLLPFIVEETIRVCIVLPIQWVLTGKDYVVYDSYTFDIMEKLTK